MENNKVLLVNSFSRFIEENDAFSDETILGLGVFAAKVEEGKLSLKLGDGKTQYKNLPEVSGNGGFVNGADATVGNLTVTGDLNLDGDFEVGNFEATAIEAQSIKINGQDISEVAKCEKGDKGDTGDPFTYDMFTPEQLETLKVKGDKGDTPTVSIDSATKHWIIDGNDTGVVAEGKDGEDGDAGTMGSVVTIGDNGNWFIDGDDTGKIAQGPKGEPGEDGNDGLPGVPGEDGITPHIGDNGNWFIGETDTGVAAQGPKGEDGEDASLSEDVATKTWVEEFVAGKILATPW